MNKPGTWQSELKIEIEGALLEVLSSFEDYWLKWECVYVVFSLLSHMYNLHSHSLSVMYFSQPKLTYKNWDQPASWTSPPPNRGQVSVSVYQTLIQTSTTSSFMGIHREPFHWPVITGSEWQMFYIPWEVHHKG